MLFGRVVPDGQKEWIVLPPTSSWVEYQPKPIRLACYVLAWSFVVMVILAVFLPLAAAGLSKVTG